RLCELGSPTCVSSAAFTMEAGAMSHDSALDAPPLPLPAPLVLPELPDDGEPPPQPARAPTTAAAQTIVTSRVIMSLEDRTSGQPRLPVLRPPRMWATGLDSAAYVAYGRSSSRSPLPSRNGTTVTVSSSSSPAPR